MVEMQNAKGTRDIPPEEDIQKLKVVDTLKRIFETFGYNPLDTPVLERYDVLASKYAGGAEILNETFRLKDQGDRELCLRYDLTVPLARYVSMNPNIKLPFKRYQVGEVFRDGPIKAGRFRQFTQCDIDAVGTKDLFIDAELLKVADVAFKELKIDTIIKVNNRKLLDAMMDASSIPVEKRMDAILAIDKIEKSGEKEVLREMEAKGISAEDSKGLFKLINAEGSNTEKLAYLRKTLNGEQSTTALDELKKVFDYLENLSVPVEFTPSLARGLSYYTGTIFEVFIKDSDISSSIAAGGRYDDMIGNFVGGPQKYPALGISFGVDVIVEALRAKKKTGQKSVVKVLVIPIKAEKAAIGLLNRIRENGIPSELNSEKKGVSKGLEYASSYGIPYVVFLGEEESSKGVVKLRDMVSGKEDLLSEEQLYSLLKDS